MASASNLSVSFGRILAIVFAMAVLGLYFYLIWPLQATEPFRFVFLLVLGGGGLFLGWRFFTADVRERRRILAEPFPEAWRKVLVERVPFYQKLRVDKKRAFEQDVQLFLGRVAVRGVNTPIDDTVRILVAASAAIPVFGFPDWEYRNLDEVLIYPGAFNSVSYAQEGPGRHALGMVGTGAMQGKVILSKPAVINGFVRGGDGQNTGIHEFVHLLDASDGAFDGIPALLDQKHVMPWLGMMHREMKRISKGKSRLRSYGATNKVEFFAVASEFFFERPDELKEHYPQLYHLLTKVFRQDLKHQFSSAFRRRSRRREEEAD